MQWTAEPNAGFSSPGIKTWLPIHPNYASGINVAEQQVDPGSLLNFYRKMIAFRKRTPALIAGDFKPLLEQAEEYLVFLRSVDKQSCLVILNMSPNEQKLAFNEVPYQSVKLLFSSYDHHHSIMGLADLYVAPFEIFIGELI
jgi:alpha-glucosidase